MKVALAQINSTVGDVAGNAARGVEGIDSARAQGAEIVVFHELVMVGYPPKDLLLRRDLLRANLKALDGVARGCTDITAVVGFVESEVGDASEGIYNAAAVCRNGRVEMTYRKSLLPSYDVFDEVRYFRPGESVGVFEHESSEGKVRVGLTVCEDLWNDHQFDGRRVYGRDPVRQSVDAGAQMIINISGSPFVAGKHADRERVFMDQVRSLHVPLVWVNQVGGNDDLLFDGASLVLDANGGLAARARAFNEDLLVVDVRAAGVSSGRVEPYPDRIESIHRGLVMGTRDYVSKCGFGEVVVGLSGGIDSAVTAALAVEALGASRVHGVAMPSRFSSDHSLADARALADNLGIDFKIVPIEGTHRAMEAAVAPLFAGRAPDVTEENMQARIRGGILMALSNKFGWLLLTTGNKSELAVGYCTLYGDMCVGLAVLSDVPKTTVYQLARRINAGADGLRIPQRSITKPPSAELAEGQTDQDSLPPYDQLDAVLEMFVEQDLPPDDIVAAGFDANMVERVVRMVDRAEYKRKQAPVGLKVTSRAFGTGRRMPIAARLTR